MPTCDIGAVNDFAARNDSKILMAITVKRMRKDPWATILDSGEWTKGEADTHKVVVGRKAAPADPLDTVMPEFEDIADSCGSFPGADAVGSTEYSYNLAVKKGRGPNVCLGQGINAFKESYKLGADALSDLVVTKMNADTRYMVLALSGIKATVNNTVDFYDTINGTEYALATPFVPNLEPNTVPTIGYIKQLGQFLTTELAVPQFEDDTAGAEGVPANIKLLAGEGLLEQLREEAGVKESTGFLTAGAFQVGKEQILSYVWQGPIRGIGFGLDPRPLRFSAWPASGTIADLRLAVVPPELPANVTNGSANVANPIYRTASFEVAFLIGGKGAFVRESLKGSGTVNLGGTDIKFPDQYNAGELNFFVPTGACDAFKENGFHVYKIARAIRPQHPHYIIPIAYKRCLNQVMPYCVGNQL